MTLVQLARYAPVVILTTSLSFAAGATPVKENIGLYGGYVADIVAMDNSGTTELLIAVENSQRGVYRYDTGSGVWGSETNCPSTCLPASDKTPGFASQIEADVKNPSYVYATLSNEQTLMNRRLYSHSDFGQAAGGSVVWQEVIDPVTSSQIDDVVILHGYGSGMYLAQLDSISVITGVGASLNVSPIFRMSDIVSLASPTDWEVVDFAIANASKGYVAIRNGSTDEYRLYALAASGSPIRITLPSASPVELRTGSCPISDCEVKVELVTFDPVDTTGNTIYIAGSSVNPMVFKSIDGGTSWDDGADFQCSVSAASACSGGEFFDGYPRGDVVRFKGTASSGVESRHVFIARTVFDNDIPATGWEVTQKLSTSVMSSGVAVTVETNANDPAIELDPNDPNKVYISTDLAIGELPHITDYLTAGSGTEVGAAQGIEGLVINDLDYFEITSTEKNLWIATKSGAAFAPSYDPTNPSSVATSANWVFPIFAGGDGAPHRAVVIDPNDKANVLMGIGSVYRNRTGDGIDPSTSTYDPTLVAGATNWTRVFNPEDFDDDPSSSPGTTDPLFSDNVSRNYATALEWQTSSLGSCDRAYLSIANTDEGLQGGIFYSDDDGATWQADTLSSGRFSAPMNTLLSNDNFLWAGVGDEFGRSSSTLKGIYARLSLCGTSDWWKPTHSDPIFTAIQTTDAVVALDGASTPSEPTISARAYIGSNEINGTTYRLTKAELTTGGSCTGFNCWQFTDVTPSTIYGEVSAVAVEPTNTNHVWVAYSNCIQESTDGGATWSDFGGACTSDHENVVALVYDDLIAGTSQGAYAYTEDTTDTDGDGVADGEDGFPEDPAASVDTDGDGMPDNWNENATDEQIAASELTIDAFAEDPAASVDTDGDGMPDDWNENATAEQITASSLTLDDDDDNDGYSDEEETSWGSDPLSSDSTPEPPLNIVMILAALEAAASDDDTSNDDEDDDTSNDDEEDNVVRETVELDDPCDGATAYSIHTHDSELWVGCGLREGLHKSSDDGVSFSDGHPSGGNTSDSDALYVFDLKTSSTGDLLVCGHLYPQESSEPQPLVMRYADSAWETLLIYGNNSADSGAVYMSNCGQIEEHPNGGLFVMSQTSADMTYSSDSGTSWSKEDRYFEEINLTAGPQAYQLQRLTSTSEGIFASGYNIAQPPTFFTPSTAEGASWFNLKAKTIDTEVEGEGWAMATPNDGSTWFVGGRNQGAGAFASAFFYRSSDNGATWTSISMPEDIDIIRDISFSSDGQYGVAVGDKYPQSKGGFVLVTSDSGMTWAAIADALPYDLWSAEVKGPYWFVGGNGSLHRGAF
ncbi:hypothetical protein N9W12_08405 [Luminiphilus sp.]|nr:hypothetical protein [Luminiphilus sp.]